MTDNKRIVTAPDLDFSRCFKIMLIDFEWDDISALSQAIKKLDGTVTLFLYGSNDDDLSWAVTQAKQSNSVLLNMNHAGKCEILKGILLPEPNVFTYGHHSVNKLFQNNVLDYYVWLAIQYEKYKLCVE